VNVRSTAELALVVPTILPPTPMEDYGGEQAFRGPLYRDGIIYRGDEASRCKVLYGRGGREARRIKECGHFIDIHV